ncbi:KEOPS complex subunit Pcc1 [Natrinema halophilum]|uniref:KEOPS complex Pcc1-like subunit n=1 Tax=Natrinema halophilum TaxID=1699371 RepID=A0A7D5GF56_9EURY|nr:KEOPS complex subunit Pcc1 [Natrinema halophilum]QLG47368.1 KEOPS complex Pcc1-like subunit [Natrinema halophilum]
MSRRATIRTAHDDPALLARALRPDNTDDMTTMVERNDAERAVGDDEAARSHRDDAGATVVTQIDRDTTSGLRTTVDDYVVNLEVAMEVATNARTVQRAQPTDTGPVSDTNSDSDTR